MLRVWFGDGKNSAIYNTSVYFKNQYKDSWITDDFARAVIEDVDKSKVLDSNDIDSPVLGKIPPEKLSGGVKALLLMKNKPGKIFNASNCGDNCAKWLLELGKHQNYTVCLYHIMNFGPGEFEIRIMNHDKMVVHNMSEFLDAADKYLIGGRK